MRGARRGGEIRNSNGVRGVWDLGDGTDRVMGPTNGANGQCQRRQRRVVVVVAVVVLLDGTGRDGMDLWTGGSRWRAEPCDSSARWIGP